MRARLETTGQEVALDGPPLGSGGEATIYPVPGRPPRAAKVYHKPTDEQAEKLAAMLAAPPADPMAEAGHVSIAWPTARLLGPAGGVVGYLMPRITDARLVYEFYNPKSRLQVCPLFHYRYLMRTARNLAGAVRALHERGYVVGDLNEHNTLVTTQALVSLVDTDSFQVPAPDRLYRCRVGSPFYTPPELQGATFAEVDRAPHHDAFGLAVLAFQLLMQGTHPFAGVFAGPGEPAPLPKRIAAGQWPYARSRPVPYRPNPHAPPWEVLSPGVRDAFVRCFEEGHDDPGRRPSAAEWQRVLHDAEEGVALCPANGQHLFYGGLAACPWCTMARQQGRDPFPAPGPAAGRPRSKTVQEPPPVRVPGALPAQRSSPATPAVVVEMGRAAGVKDGDILDALPVVEDTAWHRWWEGLAEQFRSSPVTWAVLAGGAALLVLVFALGLIWALTYKSLPATPRRPPLLGPPGRPRAVLADRLLLPFTVAGLPATMRRGRFGFSTYDDL
jgi:hypothetical protein